MAKVIYSYNSAQTMIQCDLQDQFIDINKKFTTKAEIDLDKVYFLYNGDKINEEFTFQQIVNETDKEAKSMYVLVEEINKDINEELFVKSDEIICPKCFEIIRINIKDFKVNLNECKKGHKLNDLSFREFEKSQYIDISKIICDICKEKSKGETFNHEFYRCCTCEMSLCPLCKTVHDKKHKIIKYEQKNFICDKHKDIFAKYCEDCKTNICILCEKEHKKHKTKYFGEIMPDKDELMDELSKLKQKLDIFNDNIKEIIRRLNNIINNMEIYYKINNDLVNYYELDKRNYQILTNINEFNNYNNTIIKDINKINDENDIYNKFKNLMEIYNKMNNILNEIESNKKNNELINEYINKINYKFKSEPQNLKYKLDINVKNKSQGYNDIFEVFISYKDNKEYLISRSIDNHNNLELLSLIDNKKILALKGHKNLITTVRYFINNKDNNEYIVSADWDHILIIWDITNNYNIKYRIKAYAFRFDKWSCLLVFPQNNDNNYIITSCSVGIKEKDISGTQIYSLNDGQFIKYVKNVDSAVWYLLSWYNKRNNKYYIIHFATKKIIINNLLEDELYCELTNEPEDMHFSGFIYNKENNDYLCSSSANGYINIWDLYNQKLIKSININGDFKRCILYHIIQWNSKYVVVASFNKTFKVVDIEEEKVVSEVKAHCDEVICVKKIYHPIYGESLLSSSRDMMIKLWTI